MVHALSTIESKNTLSLRANFGNFSLVKNLYSEKNNMDNIILNATLSLPSLA